MAERPLLSRLLEVAVTLGQDLARRGPGLKAVLRAVGRPLLRGFYRAGARMPAAVTSDPADPQAYRHWLRYNERPTAQERRAWASAPAVPRLAFFDPLPAGGWLALVAPDVTLADHALAALALAAEADPGAVLIYADEDRLDAEGRRLDPWLKPAWDIERVLSGQDLVGGLALVRAEALAAAGGLRTAYAGAELFDLALRIRGPISHVPMILAHRRDGGSAEARRRAVEDHLGRKVAEAAPGVLHVAWPLPKRPPLVSLIVPTRDRAELLALCAEGVLSRTDYAPLELLVVDNDSQEPATRALFERLVADPRVRIIAAPGPFNYSALNNAAAAQAGGEVLVLLNNDVEVIGPGWLTELVSNALRPDVGAVGARLLFGDGRMQHAGIVLGVGGVASYYHPFAAREAGGYGEALVRPRSVAAVTGACLAVRRTVFEAVGGLDAENLAVAFNDVDLSLRIAEAGYRNVWTPFAELYHHESATRGSDLAPAQRERFAAEVAYMRRRWAGVLETDPWYNPNFSLVDGNYRLAWPPRRPSARPAS